MAESEDFLKGITEQFAKAWAEIGSETTKSWFAVVKTVSSIANGKTEPATRPHNPWIELNHFYWNLMYENTLGNLVQMPLLGSTRGFNIKLLQAFDAWARLYPASVDYQIVLAEIQLQALEKMLQELTEKGEAAKDWPELQQLWSRTADRVFEEAFCLEDNLKIRGQLLNAVSHYKLCQQDVMEIWLKTMNLPLRSEVDEIHKNIYELRKELKDLKKTVAKSEAYTETVLPLSRKPSEIQGDLTTL